MVFIFLKISNISFQIAFYLYRVFMRNFIYKFLLHTKPCKPFPPPIPVNHTFSEPTESPNINSSGTGRSKT